MNRDTKQLWETVYFWLKAAGNKINRDYCKVEITTHPAYPSLLSIVDFLEIGEVSYKALQSDKSYIDTFSYPLLAHIMDHSGERMMMISDVREWEEKELVARWTGTVVYVEGNSDWRNPLHLLYRQDARNAKGVEGFLAFIAIGLFILSTVHFSNLVVNAFGLLSLTGLITGIVLSGLELGFQGYFVKKVCGDGQGACGQVLNSSYARGIGGFTPADLSVLYFATQFILYLLGCWRPVLLQANFLVAILGIPAAILSIFMQAVKVRQWCRLCLIVVSVLLLQGPMVFFTHFPLQDVIPEVIFSVLFVFLAVLILPVKKLIKASKSNKVQLAELKKWKMDADLFITQWEKQQVVDTTTWKNDVVIGEADAPLLITIANNPYCRPCATGHRQIDRLLSRFEGRLKVQMRFFCDPDNRRDMNTIVVKDILERTAAVRDDSGVRQILNDWFESMDYNKWIVKWPRPPSEAGEFDLEEGLIRHSRWFTVENISVTPAVFINGKKLPARYSLEDLPALIPRLEEYLVIYE